MSRIQATYNPPKNEKKTYSTRNDGGSYGYHFGSTSKKVTHKVTSKYQVNRSHHDKDNFRGDGSRVSKISSDYDEFKRDREDTYSERQRMMR